MDVCVCVWCHKDSRIYIGPADEDLRVCCVCCHHSECLKSFRGFIGSQCEPVYIFRDFYWIEAQTEPTNPTKWPPLGVFGQIRGH